MPGYDGTGPAGAGPMTGKGRGYCVMELPENEKLPEIVSGVLSEMKEPVSHDASPDETAQLYSRLSQMQIALRDLDRRIENLRKNRGTRKRS